MAVVAPSTREKPKRRPVFDRALDSVERIGNRLPDPISIFVLLALLVLVASWITARLGVTAVHPKDGSLITPVNLLTRDGLRRIFTMIYNGTQYVLPVALVTLPSMK